MHKSRRLKITDINPNLICVLCSGYLIDATTIIECLHSFCRSCIVKYLEKNKYCPICDVQVHKTKPLLNIRSDQTLQDIVYKLVPGLFQNEMCRRRDFYSQHPEYKPSNLEECGEVTQFSHIYTADESISLCLEYYNNNESSVDNNDTKKEANPSRRYLRCPAAVSVQHLKKLIRAKYDLSNEHRVDILYMNDRLRDDFTLMDIAYIYLWRRKVPLHLTYRIFEVAKRAKLEENEEVTTNKKGESENNNKTWKEVQLQISENGIMSVMNIEEPKVTQKSTKIEIKTEKIEPVQTKIVTNKTNEEVKQEQKEEKPIKEEIKEEKKEKIEEVKVGEKRKLENETNDQEPSAKIPKNAINIPKPPLKNVQQLSRNHPLKIHSQSIKNNTQKSPQKLVSLAQNQVKNTPKLNNNNNNVKTNVPVPHVQNPPPKKIEISKSESKPTQNSNLSQTVSLINQEVTITNQKVSSPSVTESQTVPKTSQNTITTENNTVTTQSVPAMSQAVISTQSITVPKLSTPISSANHTFANSSHVANTSQSIPKYTQAHQSENTITTNTKYAETSIQHTLQRPQNSIQYSKVSIVPRKSPVKLGAPIGYKTLRDPPKAWNPQISRQNLVKSNTYCTTSASTSDSKNDPKINKPAKFFKMRNNMPRYLGNPASGVKPMYQVRDGDKSPPDVRKNEIKKTDKEKSEPEVQQKIKVDKIEIKRQGGNIVKIDPKTLRPITDKTETATTSELPEMKINQSTVPILNPLRTQKSQTSPKVDRRSPKTSFDINSPKDRSSPKTKNQTSKPLNSPTSKKDKLNLNFTPPNPFVPNLTSPNLAPNQFLYPNFPSYDPRVMNNLPYHNLPLSLSMFYSQPRLNYPLSSQNLPLSPNLMSSLNLEVNKNLRVTKSFDIPSMNQLSPIDKRVSTPPKKVETSSFNGDTSDKSKIINKKDETHVHKEIQNEKTDGKINDNKNSQKDSEKQKSVDKVTTVANAIKLSDKVSIEKKEEKSEVGNINTDNA